MKRFVSNITGMLKATFVVLVITLFSVQLSASHISGGGITYKALGGGRYYIETFVLRDCNGAGYTSYAETVDAICSSSLSAGWTTYTVTHLAFVAPNPVPFGGAHGIKLSGGGGNQLVAEEVSNVCDSLLNPNIWPSTKCRNRAHTAQGYMKFRFSAIITLSSCNWWRLGNDAVCCRNTGSSNSRSGGIYTHTFINTKDYPNNSAPEFNDEHRPVVSACVGQKMSFAAGGHDPDGDSLVFELTCAMTDSTSCVQYNTGFSATSPIPGIIMDTNTGLITFTVATVGMRIIDYWVKEYDKCTGKIKAKTLRDIQVRAALCSNKVPHVSNAFGNLQGKAFRDGKGVIHVGIGETISWDETFTDTNKTDSIYVGSTVAKALKGASYKIIPTGNKYEVIVRYTWTASVGRNSNKIFSTFFNDDVCDYPGNSATTTRLKVGASVNINGGKEIGLGDSIGACVGDTITLTAFGGTRFTWTSISGNQFVPGVNWFLDTNPGVDTGKIAKLIVTQTTVLTARVTQAKDECGRIVQGVPLADTLTILANDSFSVFNVLYTILCLPDTNYLSISTSKPTRNYSYLWSPIQYLDYDTIAKPRLKNLKTDQSFNVTVMSDSGCIRVGVVNVLAAPPFPRGSFITNPDTLLCNGDTINLKLNLGAIDYGSCERTTVPCLGSAQKDTVGTASFTSDSTSLFYPLVYSSQQKSGKMQFLYTAALLKSYGLKKGLITSLGFNLDAIPSVNATYKDFTIKMSCVWNSSLSSFLQVNIPEVYTPKNYTPQVGWNTHEFDQDFAWDGASSILVEICWINAAKQRFHPKMNFYSAGYSCARSYTPSADSLACSETNLGGNSFLLPFTRFGVCSGVLNSNYKYNWSSTTTGKPSGFVSNSNADSIQIAIGSNTARDFVVTISDTSGACTQEISTKVHLLTKYNTKPDSVPPLCATAGLIQLTAPTPNNITTPGGKWSGAGIVDSRNGTWDRKKSGTGIFKVYYEITGNSCASKDSTQVSILPVPSGGIKSLDFICGSKGEVAEHELKGVVSGGSFSGIWVNRVLQGGAFVYFIDGTKFNTSGGKTDTALVRHILKLGTCIKDTLIKIPVLAHWDSTYIGVYNNGIPVFTNKFCATSGSDTLAVRGKNPIWRMVDQQHKNAITDSVNGIFNPSLIKNSKGGKVEIEVENNGFCGAKRRFFIDLNVAPEVKILSEDFCFKVPGNCIGSNVPANKELDTLLVRVAKYPFTIIDNSDTATYVDVVNATAANTGWAGLKGGNTTRWNGYFWMNFTDRCAHRYCSLPPRMLYPLSYRTAISYRPWKTDSLCYSIDSTAIFTGNNFKLNIAKTGSLCNDGKVELEATTNIPSAEFRWSDGSTITKKTVVKPGIYKVFATYKYCDTKDSVNVTSCVGLEEIEVGIEAKLYPNPTRDRITIELQGVKIPMSLQIFTMSGQLVDQFKFEPASGEIVAEVDVSGLPAGVYSFLLVDGKKTSTYRVIVK